MLYINKIQGGSSWPNAAPWSFWRVTQDFDVEMSKSCFFCYKAFDKEDFYYSFFNSTPYSLLLSPSINVTGVFYYFNFVRLHFISVSFLSKGPLELVWRILKCTWQFTSSAINLYVLLYFHWHFYGTFFKKNLNVLRENTIFFPLWNLLSPHCSVHKNHPHSIKNNWTSYLWPHY